MAMTLMSLSVHAMNDKGIWRERIERERKNYRQETKYSTHLLTNLHT